jgi:hypothetical protein
MIPTALKSVVHRFRPFYLPLITVPEPETELFELYKTHLTSDDVVVEVGARIGGTTLFLSDRKHCPECSKCYEIGPINAVLRELF